MIPLSVRMQEDIVHAKHRIRNAFCMWWIGMINNFHYTLVLAGAANIAEGYGMKKYVALISWANVFFGIGANIVNAFVLPLLSYNIRVTVTSLLAVLAILLVSFAWDLGGHNNVAAFIWTLLGVVFIGVSSNYGGSVFAGYMERLPSWQIGSWSSGTGLSGVAASLIYLGLRSVNLTDAQIFLISIIFVVAYWMLYFFGLKLPFFVPLRSVCTKEPGEGCSDPVDNGVIGYVCKAMVSWKGTPWTGIVPARRDGKPECLLEMERAMREEFTDGEPEAAPEEGDAPLGRWAGWKRDVWPLIREMHSFTLWNNFNLALVYVAEYAVQFMAPFSFTCDKAKTSKNFWLKESFVITQFCYQFGVLISRSSLLCIRIRHVWIMSIIQVLNAIAWFLQAKLKFMSDPNDIDRDLKFAFGLFAWMVFVGLMGGASYVNVFYNILEETRELQKKEEVEAMHFLRSRRGLGGDTREGNAKDEGPVCGVVEDESTEEREAIHYIATVWKEKRDLAMNIGIIYSSIGITIGALLDLLFTLVVLKGDECT